MKKTIFLDIVVFLFVVLFLYAATSKILDFDTFSAQIGKSPLIMRYPRFIAYSVPAVEILISIVLLIPRLQIIGFFMSYTLMLLFTLYISFILLFSPYVPCSCGGILQSMGWTEHLVFNTAFVLLAIAGIVLVNKRQVTQTSDEQLVNNLTPIAK